MDGEQAKGVKGVKRVEAGEVVQVGLAHSQPRFNTPHYLWSTEHHQKLLRCIKPGVGPEHCQVCIPIKWNNYLVIKISNKLNKFNVQMVSLVQSLLNKKHLVLLNDLS